MQYQLAQALLAISGVVSVCATRAEQRNKESGYKYPPARHLGDGACLDTALVQESTIPFSSDESPHRPKFLRNKPYLRSIHTPESLESINSFTSNEQQLSIILNALSPAVMEKSGGYYTTIEMKDYFERTKALYPHASQYWLVRATAEQLMYLRRTYKQQHALRAFKKIAAAINKKVKTEHKDDYPLQALLEQEKARAQKDKKFTLVPNSDATDDAATHYIVARHELRRFRLENFIHPQAWKQVPWRHLSSERKMDRETEAIANEMHKVIRAEIAPPPTESIALV